ncbi:MAG: hypothetical protein VX764_06405 [Planctomycetota bacterium]|nr:hypothetical protein [Planctomycetota bacterium]
MENGIFRQHEVEQLLGQYELFEVFTDDANSEIEASYRGHQIELSGYYANPTYIVLDSQDHLEVARGTFTNSSSEFIEFLEAGLLDEPSFESRIQLDGLQIREAGLDVTVLTRDQPWKFTGSTAGQYLGSAAGQLQGQFSAATVFRVGEDLEGEYVIRMRLVGGLYRGDERIRTFSLPIKLTLDVEVPPAL